MALTKTDVMNVLNDPILARMDFWVESLHVCQDSYRYVANLINGDYIKVVGGTSPHNAFYNDDTDTLTTQSISPPPDLEARALLLHECTHGFVDSMNFAMTRLTEETGCYLAQYTYVLLSNPGFVVPPNNPPWLHFFQQVVVLIKQFKLHEARGRGAMPPQHMPVHSKGDKTRIEMPDIESPGSSSTALIDFAQHSAIIVLPAQHVYIDATTIAFGGKIDWQLFRPQSAEDACATWTKIPAGKKSPIVCKNLGVETLNGRTAYKYQAGGFGGMRDGFLWVDQDLRVLLKMDTEGTHLVMQDLKEGPQAANLFEIPSGYQKVTFAGMVQGARQR